MQDWHRDDGGDVAEIKGIFDKVFNGMKNFMTPTIICYWRHRELLCEISCGDFLAKPIYGATFIKMKKKKKEWIPHRTQDINRCFDSEEEAKDWFHMWSKRMREINTEA